MFLNIQNLPEQHARKYYINGFCIAEAVQQKLNDPASYVLYSQNKNYNGFDAMGLLDIYMTLKECDTIIDKYFPMNKMEIGAGYCLECKVHYPIHYRYRHVCGQPLVALEGPEQ